MPLYEYQCEGCGELFEVMQKFSDEPLTTHERCGGRVHRLISAPALQFKGSGWYITDYARGSKTEADGGSKKPDAADKPVTAKTSSDTSGSSSSPATSPDTKKG